MNRHTATLFLSLCMLGVWAPAHAQNVDTGVVRFPQDIICKGPAVTLRTTRRGQVAAPLIIAVQSTAP